MIDAYALAELRAIRDMMAANQHVDAYSALALLIRNAAAAPAPGPLAVTDDVAGLSTHSKGHPILFLGAPGARLHSAPFTTEQGYAGVTFSVGDPIREEDHQILLDVLDGPPDNLWALGEMFIRAAAELEQPT